MIDDSTLMITFREFVEWENFLASEVGRLEFEEAVAENAQAVAFATASAMSGHKTVGLAKQAANANPQVAQTMLTFEMAKAKRKAYTIQRDSVARASNLISRELTRRVGRDPVERRNSRWGGG